MGYAYFSSCTMQEKICKTNWPQSVRSFLSDLNTFTVWRDIVFFNVIFKNAASH